METRSKFACCKKRIAPPVRLRRPPSHPRLGIGSPVVQRGDECSIRIFCRIPSHWPWPECGAASLNDHVHLTLERERRERLVRGERCRFVSTIWRVWARGFGGPEPILVRLARDGRSLSTRREFLTRVGVVPQKPLL